MIKMVNKKMVLGLAVIVFMLISSMVHGTTDTIGSTSGGTDYFGVLKIVGFKVTASASGTLQSVGINLYSAGGSNIGVGIYTSNGVPDALLGNSTLTASINGWNDLTIPQTVTITQGTDYFLVLNTGGSSGVVYYESSGGTIYQHIPQTLGTWSDPFAYTRFDGMGPLNMRMVYDTTTTTSTTTSTSTTSTSTTSTTTSTSTTSTSTTSTTTSTSTSTTINPQLYSTSWTTDINPIYYGLYQLLIAIISGGTSPYTYNYTIFANNGTLIANMTYVNASTSNTYEYQQLAGWSYGTFIANITINDSGINPQYKVYNSTNYNVTTTSISTSTTSTSTSSTTTKSWSTTIGSTTSTIHYSTTSKTTIPYTSTVQTTSIYTSISTIPYTLTTTILPNAITTISTIPYNSVIPSNNIGMLLTYGFNYIPFFAVGLILLAFSITYVGSGRKTSIALFSALLIGFIEYYINAISIIILGVVAVLFIFVFIFEIFRKFKKDKPKGDKLDLGVV